MTATQQMNRRSGLKLNHLVNMNHLAVYLVAELAHPQNLQLVTCILYFSAAISRILRCPQAAITSVPASNASVELWHGNLKTTFFLTLFLL